MSARVLNCSELLEDGEIEVDVGILLDDGEFDVDAGVLDRGHVGTLVVSEPGVP